MKILLLPSYYNPEKAAGIHLNNNRNEDFIKVGFELLVIVPTPCRGITADIRNEYKKKHIEKLYNGQMTVTRFWMFREPINPILRAFRYTLICIGQFYRGLLANDIDLILTASTPPIQGAMSSILKKIKKTPFVYNLQDIFPDSLVATGLAKKGSLIWKVGRRIEDFTYRNADRIIVISEGFKKNIMNKGVPESKIEVIYNWVDENEVLPVERNQNILFDRYGLSKDKFYITYNGTIGLTQNMDLLLEVVSLFKDLPDIHFILMGEGAYKTEVKKQISNGELKNITLLPFQPYDDISLVFSLGDVGLVLSKENVGQNSVPSKTWSIMSASRPVVASFDEGSEIQQIIEQNQVGLFVKAGDKMALYNAIMKLYDNPELCKKMGQKGREFIMSHLRREIATSKYIDIINTLVK